MHRAILSVALLAGALSGAEAWRFEPRVIEESVPGCGDPKDGCAHVEFRYLEAYGGTPAARERVNQAIRDAIVSRPKDGLTVTPETYAKRFVADYEKFKGEQKDSAQRWNMNKNVKLLRANSPALCLEYTESSYAGGAHGNEATVYLTFDPRTGEKLKLASLLRPGALPRLIALAEAAFRKQRELAPDADLKAAGFHFKNGRFALNDNFGVAEDALLFHYNSYEIAAYVMGPTTISLPLAAVRQLLRK